MDAQAWINIIAFIVLPIMGFVIGLLIRWLVTIQKDLNEHKLFVANNYPMKSEMNSQLEKIEKTLEKIFDRINLIAERRSHEREPTEIRD